MSVNINTIVLGTLFLYATGNVSTNVKNRPFVQHLLECLLYAVQTFFAMGISNLAGVNSANHAIQLGLYLFIGFRLPEIYYNWAWHGQSKETVQLTILRGMLSTAGLTWLVFFLGSAIYLQ